MNATFDSRRFSIDVHKLARLEDRTGAEELQHQMKLLIRDIIRLTPPTGPNALSESFKIQRDIGKAAVRSGIDRNWKAANALLNTMESTAPKAAESLKKYIRSGDVEKVKTMLRRMRFRTPELVIESVTEADHDKARSAKTGRATGPQQLVLRSNSIKALVRAKLSHVGSAKGGWAKAAKALGVSIPEWIAGQATPGDYAPNLSGDKKSITAANFIRFAGNLPKSRIIDNAMMIRQRSMQQRIGYLLRK